MCRVFLVRKYHNLTGLISLLLDWKKCQTIFVKSQIISRLVVLTKPYMKMYFVCPSKTSNTETTFSFLIKLSLSADSFFFFIPLFPSVSRTAASSSCHVFTQSLTKWCVCVGRTSCLCRRTDNVMTVVIGKTMSNSVVTRRRTDPDWESIRRKENSGEVDIYLGCLSASVRPHVWRAGWRTEGCGETLCDRNWGCSRNQRLHNLEGEKEIKDQTAVCHFASLTFLVSEDDFASVNCCFL